jgi:glycosyltransferase involved in cell wall biosynthesis
LHDNLPVEHTLDYWFLSKFYQHNYVSISLNQRKGSIPLNFVGNAYHGIDADKYEFSDGQGEHYAFMGRLMEKKGAHIAIQVTKETNNLLYIASDKLLYDTHYVKEEIFPHVDNKQINLTEFLLTPEQKSKFFKHAKATLFPIMWEEPFGWVMIESMVCGAPVIAYAMGSVPEVIKDGETGFIINSSEDNIRGDWIIKKTGIEGIREAMNRIDNMSREEIARMRQNCREHVKANFSINKVGEQYENIYNRLLSA